jgi:tetratricopeptide (TPR) repeat protein
VKSFYFAAPAEQKRIDEDAAVAIDKALDLDSNLADAHLARGLILWTHAKKFPHELAIRSFKRAIELNPNLAEAHHQLGVVYNHIGLLDKGKKEIEKALELNPDNTMARFRLGTFYFYAGNYDEALNIFKSTPADANRSLQVRSIAATLFELGKYEEARVIADEFLQKFSDEGGAMTSIKALLFAHEGNRKEAEAAIQRAIDIGQTFGHFHHTSYNIACAYSLMHNPKDAVKWLQYSADDGLPCYPLFENDPLLNNIRNDAGFISFLASQKKQWEHYKATL